MKQKYYFICYSLLSRNGTFNQIFNCVTSKHPVRWLLNKRICRGNYSIINLISWKEISETEYNLFTCDE